MKLKTLRIISLAVLLTTAAGSVKAQSELYPKHFDLEQVTLTDGPMNTAMELNFKMLLQYDTDRLLNPYIRQSGLNKVSTSKYYQWEVSHPSFANWGKPDFNLDGHVGGHYLSALSLAYAATDDVQMKAKMKERLDYMVTVMKDCQSAYDNNTEGLKGFIGGQPMNEGWKLLYKDSDLRLRGEGACAVPWYCQHKILAGLRDAYIYGDNLSAREVFLKLCDWCILVTSKLTDEQMERMLGTEHGGVNETLLDAYALTGKSKYLTAAKRFTHKQMLNGMQDLSATFLDNRHANTQVPKYIGMERIGEYKEAQYMKAAENFWTDVTQNRTTCIGGNSVSEHFLTVANSNRYIDRLDGPESCNTNNMLKLTEMMGDYTHDAKYADFYEYAMWNHILSTQDPVTGGYVYFTTLRPQGYRIYSQVNQGMWCCVGTGMENHSKYGHFIYTHDGAKTLYVNLFTASKLTSKDFVVTQETQFPFANETRLTIGKAGNYTIAIRHPQWATDGYRVAVNGETVNAPVSKGVASYIEVKRKWAVGDVVTVTLPMELRYTACPNYNDYIAFQYGPILLAARTSTSDEGVASVYGLTFEPKLQNVYAGEGRMDHAPGNMASSKSLLSAPLLIGSRANVLQRINAIDLSKLTFTIDASRNGTESYQWRTLILQPFYQIHHARYQCYWYQQTPEAFAKSAMAKTEAANEALNGRTIDFVAPGEQQSEAGHEFNYSDNSTKGNYNGESYRDARAGGHVEYALYNKQQLTSGLSVLCRFITSDKGRKASLLVDDVKIADIEVPAKLESAEQNGFYNIEFPIPAELLTNDQGNAKQKFVVRLSADQGTMNPGMYYLRLMKP